MSNPLNRHRKPARRLATATLVLLMVGVLSLPALSANAESAPAAGPVGLSVSTPNGTLAAVPGQTIATWVRVSNNGNTPLQVAITPATVVLGNNGDTHMSSTPDPRFPGRMTFSTSSATVQPNTQIKVVVTIAVPTTLVPDIYLLGLVVTPTPAAGSVQVVNQVGALFAVDLPGSRDRRLTATWIDPPHFVFDAHPTLTLRVRNIGKSALTFTAESMITGSGHIAPANIRQESLLLPAGRYRDVTVKWTGSSAFAVQTVTSRVVFHKTQATTAQALVNHTIILISIPLLIALGGLVLLIIGSIVFLIMRRQRSNSPGRIRGETNPLVHDLGTSE